MLAMSAPAVLGNDDDVDGNPLTGDPVSGRATASLTLNGNGGFTYTPTPTTPGPTASPTRPTTAPATRTSRRSTITVNRRNDIPVAATTPTARRGRHARGRRARGAGNDSDGRDLLSVTVVGFPTDGTLLMDAEGEVHRIRRPRLERARQLHLSVRTTARQLEPRHGDDHGELGERPAGGAAGQLHHGRGHASGRGRSGIEGNDSDVEGARSRRQDRQPLARARRR